MKERDPVFFSGNYTSVVARELSNESLGIVLVVSYCESRGVCLDWCRVRSRGNGSRNNSLLDVMTLLPSLTTCMKTDPIFFSSYGLTPGTNVVTTFTRYSTQHQLMVDLQSENLEPTLCKNYSVVHRRLRRVTCRTTQLIMATYPRQR